MDRQLYQPLNLPNQDDADDYKNFYNDSKEPDYHTYLAINPNNYEDLVPPTHEWDGPDSTKVHPRQLYQPLILEN